MQGTGSDRTCMTCSHYMRCLKKWLCNTRRSKFGFSGGFYPPISLKYLIGSHFRMEPTKETNKLIFPILRVKTIATAFLVRRGADLHKWQLSVLGLMYCTTAWITSNEWGIIAGELASCWKNGSMALTDGKTSVGGILLTWYAAHESWDSPVTSSIYDCSTCSNHPYPPLHVLFDCIATRSSTSRAIRNVDLVIFKGIYPVG